MLISHLDMSEILSDITFLTTISRILLLVLAVSGLFSMLFYCVIDDVNERPLSHQDDFSLRYL